MSTVTLELSPANLQRMSTGIRWFYCRAENICHLLPFFAFVPTAELAAELVAAIPEARLVTIPDAGHQLPLEAPDELTQEILALSS